MSLLSISNDVCDIIAIPRIVAVANGTGGDARQMLRLANREGNELARRTSWQALAKTKTFASLAQETQTGALPTDFQFIINETFFNRTAQREVYGPIPPREWQLLKATTSNAITDTFRIAANSILLNPVPGAGQTYAYEYITKYWATSADGLTEKRQFETDTDIPRLEDWLMTLGIVWRWKASKGIDYAEDFRTYEMQVAQAITRDGGKRTITFAGDRPPAAPRVVVPEGNWTP